MTLIIFIYNIKIINVMKVTKTYSIEESIYNAFDSLTTERKINKSSFIEDIIKKFLKDNDMDFVDKLYSLKDNPNHIVTVTSQDNIFYYLSDGSKIQKILFMQIFKECEAVNPKEFFNKYTNIFENLADKIKSIDETKVEDIPKSSPSSFESILNKMDEAYKTLSEKNENSINKLYCKFLNDFKDEYNSIEYRLKSKAELCEDIIRLMSLKFDIDTDEYKLKEDLISKVANLKNSKN
jgi:uncharacterized protein (UPF0297 family)